MNSIVPVPADSRPEDVLVLQAALTETAGSREQLRELMVRDPTWIDRIGALAADAERAMLESAKAQMIIEEAWRADLQRVRASLSQSADGALERLLVERVVLAWAALTLAEMKRDARLKAAFKLAEAAFWDRHVATLNREFLRATRTLAAVRRLRIPAIQVNVGQQQVNVAG